MERQSVGLQDDWFQHQGLPLFPIPITPNGMDKYGDLRADAVHHDGTNHYLYRVFKDGVTDTQIENLQDKIQRKSHKSRHHTVTKGSAMTLPEFMVSLFQSKDKQTNKRATTRAIIRNSFFRFHVLLWLYVNMPAKVCERSILPGESIVPRTIRNCILFGYTGGSFGIDAVGKIAEKIMAEDAGDAPEQVDVDILFRNIL